MYPVYKPTGTETQCKEVPVTFPAQHQDRQPGLEYVMVPRPISENPTVQGSGKLNGKVAIVSGGDSGIGRAVAIAYAREGAKLTIAYLDEHVDAEETRKRVMELGGECLLIPGDLKAEAHNREVVRRTIERYGKLDIVVNNLAVQFVQENGLSDISAEQLELTFRTNIFPFFYMTRAALPYLDKGSSVINTASITAYQGAKELIDYSATKGAIVSFTRSLSLSLVSRGIRVNAVAPGPIWTPLIPASYPAEAIPTFGTDTPMGRAGQPFEMAGSYVFLASDDASYMSGQVLHPNGGSIVDS